jgi:hypothetical protein
MSQFCRYFGCCGCKAKKTSNTAQLASMNHQITTATKLDLIQEKRVAEFNALSSRGKQHYNANFMEYKRRSWAHGHTTLIGDIAQLKF